MRHQTQIPLDEYVAGRQIALGGQFQLVTFLLRTQRLGEGAAGPGEAQGLQHTAEYQPCGG